MDSMSYRNNRPNQRPAEQSEPVVAPQPVAQTMSRGRKSHESPKRSKLWIIGAVVAVALLAFGAWYLFARPASTTSIIDGNKYQAVFFTNGQVYFGKLSVVNNDYMRLKNVFYLQTKSASDDNKTSPQSAAKQDASDVELIKLGNEIHGPADEMLISRDQVLFFENLKDEGTVSKTIAQYQKSNN